MDTNNYNFLYVFLPCLVLITLGSPEIVQLYKMFCAHARSLRIRQSQDCVTFDLEQVETEDFGARCNESVRPYIDLGVRSLQYCKHTLQSPPRKYLDLQQRS